VKPTEHERWLRPVRPGRTVLSHQRGTSVVSRRHPSVGRYDASINRRISSIQHARGGVVRNQVRNGMENMPLCVIYGLKYAVFSGVFEQSKVSLIAYPRTPAVRSATMAN
jgi:hypothetical protein